VNLTIAPSTCDIATVITLEEGGASQALAAAAIWSILVQISLAITGTFILKRFSTSFSIGFLLGLVALVAQQNFLLSVVFWNNTNFGSVGTNTAFANFSFATCAVHTLFVLIAANFRENLVSVGADAGRLDSREENGA
jgi:hypothetical protein